MLAAIGAPLRLRLLRLLLASHPTGRVAGDLSAELAITPSTLSHHLDRLKREDLITARREGTFLWYTANTSALEQLLRFLFTECCTHSRAIPLERITT